MDIKCKTNPYYNFYQTPTKYESPSFHGAPNYAVVAERAGVKLKTVMNGANCGVKNGVNADKFVRRPVATKSATGLLGYAIKGFNSVRNYAKNYVENVSHTFNHKIVFALIEKELYGKNSIDAITHDLDKMILHLMGFSKKTVTKIHRQISEHHVESGKKPNLRSMVCDNIASSPEFKPEKQHSVRNFYNISKDLQAVDGLGDAFEKCNYGENLNFEEIKNKRLFDIKKPYQFIRYAYQIIASFII